MTMSNMTLYSPTLYNLTMYILTVYNLTVHSQTVYSRALWCWPAARAKHMLTRAGSLYLRETKEAGTTA